ncbi:MAG TPA: Ig-like domain-containing protein [Thermoanaerobaculia bacterium]
MWRWVTRGLVLTVIALCASAMVAQTFEFHGALDAPDPAKTHSGLVLVQGWALNPITINSIELYVDDQFQHKAIMFLPRIDVEQAYPDWPGIHNARPGFVTGFLASRFPDGQHTVEIRVRAADGQVHALGRRTITINNSVNQPPFGFTDIPDGAGVYNVSGAFPVSGWAADTDGIQKIEVLIDNGIVGAAVHGDPRPDVGQTFPDFTGATFSGWVANIDSTKLQNGIHTLTVRATDKQGIENSIGHRTVQIINNDAFLKPFGYLDEPKRDAVLFGTGCLGDDNEPPPVSPPIRVEEHLTLVRGWALDLGTREGTGRVAYAELLIDGVPWLDTGDCGVVGGRFSNCYGVPRYDVAKYYPNFPDAPRAGFIFTLDVGALLELGVREGNHNMHVRVGDVEQTFAEIPNRDGIPVWFQCVQEDFNFSGFGFVEYPTTFDYVSGDVMFRGWAFADNSNVAAVEIIIDGTTVGQAQHGFPRPDVEDQYPQNAVRARNSGWQFTMDTRKLANTLHRLTVRVVNSQGHRWEIGSVDFYVLNNSPQP